MAVILGIDPGSRITGTTENGRLAQLGEHLPYKEEVIGSIPIATTNSHLLNGSLAQLVEQLTLNQLVDSSSLSGPTIQTSFIFFFYLLIQLLAFLTFLFYFFLATPL